MAASVSFVAALPKRAQNAPERWFFFAQATHPQNLYYQRVA